MSRFIRTGPEPLKIHIYDAGARRVRVVDNDHTWVFVKPPAWAVMTRTQKLTWIGHMIDTMAPVEQTA